MTKKNTFSQMLVAMVFNICESTELNKWNGKLNNKEVDRNKRTRCKAKPTPIDICSVG